MTSQRTTSILYRQPSGTVAAQHRPCTIPREFVMSRHHAARRSRLTGADSMCDSIVIRRVFPVMLVLATLALAWNIAEAADWPTFRGAERTAVSKETGLLQEWSASGPPLVCDIHGAGRGYSSLAVAAGRIYTLGDGPSDADDKDEYLLCFEQAIGKPLWKTKTGPAWNAGQSSWQSSRSTPTVDGDLVFIITPHGELVCCETALGRERWRKN